MASCSHFVIVGAAPALRLARVRSPHAVQGTVELADLSTEWQIHCLLKVKVCLECLVIGEETHRTRVSCFVLTPLVFLRIRFLLILHHLAASHVAVANSPDLPTAQNSINIAKLLRMLSAVPVCSNDSMIYQLTLIMTTSVQFCYLHDCRHDLSYKKYDEQHPISSLQPSPKVSVFCWQQHWWHFCASRP